MDLNNPVIKLCIAGSQAEFAGQPERASELYQQAWQSASDDYEACIAAHYLARFQPSPADSLRWNQEALRRAEALKDGRAKDFYPSLYLNLGRSYELLGDPIEARRYYDLAANLGFHHLEEDHPNTP